MANKVKDPNKPSRISQIRQSYQITKKSDPRIGLILLGTFVLAAAGGVAALFLIGIPLVFAITSGVLIGTLAVLIVFGRRAQAAALAAIDGQPGAAAAALGMLRRGWKLDPAIGFTKQQDVVHRLVGPPGIILVGEGNINEPLPLDRIPPLVFSEILRDVDLFVGVASVGNDPTWQDGGPGGRFQTYWQSYSFGELSETAKTRRGVLETLLPRLTKLKDRWQLDERFLVIRG